MEEMVSANHLLTDEEALRSQFDRDGYLFFEKIIDQELIHALRNDITQVLSDCGWIDSSRPMDAAPIGFPYRENEPEFGAVMRRLGKLESFHAFKHQPAMQGLLQKVLGESAFPHPLSLMRATFPDNPEVATPPHQDFPNNQGTPQLTACWTPLGDCPQVLGGLAILRGSHKFGVLPLEYHLGPGARAAVVPDEMAGLEWVARDFEVGDTIVFPALTVHRALPNLTDGQMRLSVDYRFMLEGQELTESCLQPHMGGLTWPEVYEGWQSTDYQYYWLEREYQVVPWDDSYHELPDEDFAEALLEEFKYNKERERRYRSATGGR